MTVNVLYADEPGNWPTWGTAIKAACKAAGLSVTLSETTNKPDAIDYIIYAPSSGLEDFSPFSNLKAVLSLWAGVDKIVSNPTIRCPITRMSDDGLKYGMIDYVVGHVMRYHLSSDVDVTARTWVQRAAPPLAHQRQIGILGCGALGQACGAALKTLGFKVQGWARTQKSDALFEVVSGQDGLAQILGASDYLVLLLPDTRQTQNIICADTIAMMKPGAVLINAGRGPSINDEDLITGLDAGRLEAATLDVFRTEPLPDDHPFWSHPKITVTPHIAATTRPETAATLIAENIRRAEAGEALRFEVNKDAGY